MKGTEQIAQRIINAENAFIESVVEQFDITEEEGEKVLNAFIKVKAVKIDPVMGQFNLTNGAFWDKQVIENAINF